jgi:hypothetical protein
MHNAIAMEQSTSIWRFKCMLFQSALALESFFPRHFFLNFFQSTSLSAEGAIAAFKLCVNLIDIMVCAHVLFSGQHQHGQTRQQR